MLNELKTNRLALLVAASIVFTFSLGCLALTLYIFSINTGDASAGTGIEIDPEMIASITRRFVPVFAVGVVAAFLAWISVNNKKSMVKLRQQQEIQKEQQSGMPDHILLDQEIARLSVRGWQIINRTEISVQMKKPKKVNTLLALLGLILTPLGVGLIVLLLLFLDYLSQKEKVIFFTANDIRAGVTSRY